MTPPGIRRTGLLDRTVQHRDARLFLVASEDRYAVQQYFDALDHNAVIDTRRVRIVVLATGDDGRSDPLSVFDRLTQAEKDLDELRPMDERWLCVDLDHWGTASHAPNLARACQRAAQASYEVAVSNPSFEAWLLLHFCDDCAPTQAKCEAAIREAMGSYDKTKLRVERYTPERVAHAVERARRLDADPNHRWPQQPGSRVYRLIERLPQRG